MCIRDSYIGIQISCQFCLIYYANIGFCKDMRIFQRLIVTFGRANDNDFLCFAQVEHGRTNKVADVLYKKYRVIGRRQMFDSVVHHIGFQMAAGPGVDLENGNIQCGNAVGIDVYKRQSIRFPHCRRDDGPRQSLVHPNAASSLQTSYNAVRGPPSR